MSNLKISLRSWLGSTLQLKDFKFKLQMLCEMEKSFRQKKLNKVAQVLLRLET